MKEETLKNLFKRHDKEQFVAVCRYIAKADYETIAHLLAEIICVHDNLIVWNEKHKTLDSVESVSINGEAVQLNLQNGGGN